MGIYRASVVDAMWISSRVSVPDIESRALIYNQQTVPPPIDVCWLIDTGQSHSSISPKVVDHLKLQAVGYPKDLHTALPPQEVDIGKTVFNYQVKMEWLGCDLDAMDRLTVVCLQMPDNLKEFDGVVGRNLLRKWEEFSYFGTENRLVVIDKTSATENTPP